MNVPTAALAVALSSGQTKIVVVLLAMLGVGGVTAALFLVFGNKEEAIADRLERYSVPGATHAEDQSMVDTALMKQAVDFTGRVAERTGLLQWLENSLEQSDLPVRAPEALFFYVVGVLFTFLLLLVLMPTIFGALFLTIPVAALPHAYLARKRAKRKKSFETQLPDTLQHLAGAMRSGFSLLQALESVADESAEPMKRELDRVLTETRLGRSLEDGLDDCAVRIKSLDLTWAVMAIRIQREVGGNLAELLDNVSETMAQRDRLRGEIKALTAEGRYSGIILGIMPLVFGGMLYSMAPDFMKPLTEDTVGYFVLGGTFVLSAVGFLWIRKIMDIEV